VRVLFDARAAAVHRTGVGAIARGMLRGLSSVAHAEGAELHIVGSSRWDDLPDGSDYHELPSRGFMHYRLPKLARELGAQAILVPRQTVPIAVARPIARACMIYDIGFLRQPEIYDSGIAIRLTTRLACRVSAAVFSLSDFTSSELIAQHLASAPHTLPIGAVHRYSRTSPGASPYALVVATQQRHKNIAQLIRAWDRRARGDWRLVICGGTGSGTHGIQAALRSALRPQSIVVRGFVPDEEMIGIEAGASLHINASLYEGLGIPLMNAMCSGVPMISAAAGYPGRLLSGHQQFLFDPRSTESMDHLITHALTDDRLRSNAAAAGPRLVSLTDWSQVARVMLERLRRETT
jgi:glycosyltransferase involved in cell wall biosynthesis